MPGDRGAHERGLRCELEGVTALPAMLNSCASGVSVVNIDNGFGAGFQASLINHLPGREACYMVNEKDVLIGGWHR
ncbi:MAG: hypothetical protein ACLT5H_10390 [Collinsella stercoris]|uniref:hypothetical protein n=1 Tax=Collinsella stercoris TaxID=147206 RepID=UPI0039938850